MRNQLAVSEHQPQSLLHQYQARLACRIIVALSCQRLEERPLLCDALPSLSNVPVRFGHTQLMHFLYTAHARKMTATQSAEEREELSSRSLPAT